MITKQKTLDYNVVLYSEAIDPEDGMHIERITSVQWDEGISQDWDEWLKHYNEFEPQPFTIFLIIPIDPDFEGEF